MEAQITISLGAHLALIIVAGSMTISLAFVIIAMGNLAQSNSSEIAKMRSKELTLLAENHMLRSQIESQVQTDDMGTQFLSSNFCQGRFDEIMQATFK